MTDALIHLRVPAALKGRWVRASRAAGMRLTDWIVRAVETRMEQQIALITIPEDVSFADLQYRRESDGSVSFRWEPIERICEASGLDVRIFRDAPEDVSVPAHRSAACGAVRWSPARRGEARATTLAS